MTGTVWVLHSKPQAPGGWWACEYPERPLDDYAECDLFCPKCFIAAEADIAMYPNKLTMKYEPNNTDGVICLFSDVVKEHVRVHGHPSEGSFIENSNPEDHITW